MAPSQTRIFELLPRGPDSTKTGTLFLAIRVILPTVGVRVLGPQLAVTAYVLDGQVLVLAACAEAGTAELSAVLKAVEAAVAAGEEEIDLQTHFALEGV